VAGVERWLEAVDRDRDLAAMVIAGSGATPVLEALLDRLTRERAEVVALLERLRADRHHPALLLPARPQRMAKALLTPRRRQRMGAVR
jgi:hypothetical protein